jgi:hypothetical protein
MPGSMTAKCIIFEVQQHLDRDEGGSTGSEYMANVNELNKERDGDDLARKRGREGFEKDNEVEVIRR